MQISKKTQRQLFASLIVCLFTLMLTFAVCAEETYIKVNGYENNTVDFSVESEVAYDKAVVMVSGYAGDGRFTGAKLDTVAIPVGTYSLSTTLADDTATFQVMLLDAETYEPLCPCGKEYTVTFSDKDGDILSRQTVYSGNAAFPPEAPTVAGYIFAGWDTAYDCVTEDIEPKATYIAEDSQNLFTVSSVDGAPGNEITVFVRLGGTVMLCGYDMRLTYDSDVLEFVSLDSEFSMDVVANHVSSSSSIRFNYSSRSNRTSSGDIMEVTFRIKDGAPTQGTTVRLEPIEVIFVDESALPAECEYAVTEGVVRVQ